MGVKEFLENLRAKKSRYKEFEEGQRIQQKFVDRSKSSNERELERFMKEEREDNIKKELEEFRNKKQKESQYGNQLLAIPNMFHGKEHSMLKQPNIFSTKQNIMHKEAMFFKA